MNKIKYLLILVVSFCLFSCEKNEIPFYKDPAALYFADFDKGADSLVFSFTMSAGEEDTLKLRVNLLGNALTERKAIPLRVVEEESSAIAGVHYKQIEDVYVDEKTGKCNIPVVLTYEKSMDSEIYVLTLELYKDEFYDVAYKGKHKVRLMITNQLVKPDYWESLLSLYFGAYSKVKHQKAIELMGHDFPLKKDDIKILGNKYYMSKGRELCYYYALNQEYDENGNLIEVWDPF